MSDVIPADARDQLYDAVQRHRPPISARRVEELGAALDAMRGWLVDRTIVYLPEPDDNTDRLEGATAQWSLPYDVIGVYPDTSRPIYSWAIGGHLSADEAEAEGTALIAAARLWRQRASESAQ